jgi:hypothetical protein
VACSANGPLLAVGTSAVGSQGQRFRSRRSGRAGIPEWRSALRLEEGCLRSRCRRSDPAGGGQFAQLHPRRA